MQGTTATKYMIPSKNMTTPIFLTVNHYYRYDIPSAYNPKLGHIYTVLLFDKDNNLVAIGEKHPINGESIIIKEFDKYFMKNGKFFWEVLKNTTLSAYKDKINDYETKKIKKFFIKYLS